MAVATSLALGATTATAIAAGSAAVGAASSGLSFLQAGKQRRLQQQAQSDAAKALEEARKRTEVNVYKSLNINDAPYEMKSEALLSQGAQAIEALREGGVRGVAGGVGRLQQAQAQAQEENRLAYGQDISQMQQQIANEESRLRDINIQLDLGEVAGSQQLAADAAEKAAAANQAGFTQAAGAVKQGLETFVPLFTQRPQMTTVGATPTTAMPTLGTPRPTFNQGIATTLPLPPQLLGQRPLTTNVPTGMYQGQGQINYPYNPFQITMPQYQSPKFP
jgi:hypothetical protein